MPKPLDLSPNAPWKARFRAPTIAWAQIARANAKRGIVFANFSGIYQLHAWDVETGALRQITDQPAGVNFGAISVDGAYIYYLRDEQGDELGHFVRAPFGGGEPEDMTPDLPRYASWSIHESRGNNMIGLMAAHSGKFHYYVIEKLINGGLDVPRPLWTGERLAYGGALSHDGDVAVIATTERSGTTDTGLISLYTNSGRVLQELYEEHGSISPVRFAPLGDSFTLLAATDISGYERPLLWNVRTGERTDIPLPEVEGALSPNGWSRDGEAILLSGLNRAESQLYVYDLPTQTLNRLDHPSGVFDAAEFTESGEILAIHHSSVYPRRLIALDSVTGAIRRVVLEGGDAPLGTPLRSVTFPSTGGAQTQGWLGVPSEGDAPYPLILEMHGGPTAVKRDGYDPMQQAWLDHGFAVLSINYRGSITFGRDFEHAIDGKLGTVEVDDVAAARDWAVAQGIARPDAVLLTGWSYGGYLTLQTLSLRPDLWAGGMAGVAIADWVTMYEDQADTLRGYQRALFGGTPDEKPEAHRQASPITHAERLQAPVLIIQGSNDTRCPPRQMRIYEEKLRSLGKQVQVHWFDAGHGSRAVEQSIEHQSLMLEFAYKTLGI